MSANLIDMAGAEHAGQRARHGPPAQYCPWCETPDFSARASFFAVDLGVMTCQCPAPGSEAVMSAMLQARLMTYRAALVAAEGSASEIKRAIELVEKKQAALAAAEGDIAAASKALGRYGDAALEKASALDAIAMATLVCKHTLAAYELLSPEKKS